MLYRTASSTKALASFETLAIKLWAHTCQQA
jgi:hypothetical protein